MAIDIGEWLKDIGLVEHLDAFIENAVDVDLLPELTNEDLKDIGVAKLGDRKKILLSIKTLEPGIVDSQSETGDSVRLLGSQSEAERRQLTVMFCDLVDSTALSQRLDPEDLRDIIQRYQNSVSGAVSRYGGHVARFVGDGVLAYFGWPHAYEDQDERAVRAGLDATVAVADLGISCDETLRTRIGIASGQVVVGDLVGEGGLDAEAVTGITPNLAARLQGLAEPGQIVVSETTAHLLGQSFAMDDLGHQDLKGFDRAKRAWVVTGEIMSESRFEAATGTSLTHIVGRQSELQLLLDRWELVEGNEGQVVLISGEAGIGKSRLMQGLCDKVATRDHIRIHYQCSPYHANSALYPTIQQLQRASGFSPHDDGESKLDKLEELLRETGSELVADASLFANLLSLPYEARYGALTQPAQQIKERLLEALITQILGLAKNQPVLFLFEDVHWIDPTSQELLDRIIARIHDAKVFLFVTHRPDWRPPPSGHNHTTSLQLNRLGKAQGAEIVRAIAGQKISDDMITRVIERTDGVPLFIEELTKSLMEGGLDSTEADIPMTLQASLLARIDRLGVEAKEITQIGAVIGREFPHNLLLSVSGKTDEELNAALDRLVQSELVFRIGTPPNAKYTFKHSLIQDAAYRSLLRKTQRNFHQQVAEVLESYFPEITKTQPELLAHHFTAAKIAEKSVRYWYQAGQLAVERSTNLEAIAHLTAGKAILEAQPESIERDAQELDYCLALGPALMSTKGLAAVEAEEVYLRARHLCQSVDHADLSFQATWGLWLVYQQRGQIDQAQAASDEVLSLAEQQRENVDYLLQAHHAAWTTHLFVGNVSASQSHVAEGNALYDIDKHNTHAFTYGGHDPGVCAKTTASEGLCLLGYPDQAVQNAVDGVALAEKLSHPFSLAMAHYFVAQVHQYRLEVDTVRTQAQTAIAMCELHDFESFRAQATVLFGWATATGGEHAFGIEQIYQGLNDWQATGTGMRRPYFLALLADALLHAERFEEGLETVTEALALIESTGETRWHAETLRLKGAMMHFIGGAVDDIETSYQHAIEIAQEQEARWLELRAATSLAKLRCNNGKESEMHNLLDPLFSWFTEGLETPDLIDAQALLNGFHQ